MRVKSQLQRFLRPTEPTDRADKNYSWVLRL
nr:MAG TPA: hypothetical protein [Caudoviricetes sp.]